MGGKTNTTQNQVSTYTPTQQASNLYTNVINQATAAQSPYNPATARSVAGFTDAQSQAFGNIAANQNIWRPDVNAGANAVGNAAQGIGAADISNFYNPFQQDVIDTTMADVDDANAMAMRQYTANQTAQSGLGGSGFGIGRAQLAGDQGQARSSTLANLRSSGWDKALAAAQTDKTRGMQAGQTLAGIGQLRSQLAGSDASQMLAAGNQQQAQQQTQLDTTSQNEREKQLFPMQQAQWLASLASGIGPLTGGTTAGSGTSSTSQGKGIGNVIGGGLTLMSMMSDERAKENPVEIGRTHDGQPIYEYNYKGDPRRQIGLMAQDVEQHHPEAVSQGLDGLKRVDYGAALEGARPGAADGGRMDLDEGIMGWAPIRPANVTPPALASMSSPQQQEDSFDPQAAMALGKSARGGLDKLMGFGSSPAPMASSPAGGAMAASGLQGYGGEGGGLAGLASMFGFADGGIVYKSPNADYFKPTPEEMHALEMQESGGRDIVNPKSGAFGPRQIMPATARDPGFGVAPLKPGASVDEQRRFSDDYFSAMLRRYNGDRDAARIAYNGGPRRADNWIKAGRDDSVIPAESANYYKAIAAKLGAPAANLVAKAKAPDAVGERYASTQDRATGGMLKRMFGVDFNPLGLDENERKALMVAGLSMLSSGDVGRGGLAGMQYLAGTQAGEREQRMAQAKLDYDMRKDAADLALRTRGVDLSEKKDAEDLKLRRRVEDRQLQRDADDQAWRTGETERKNAELTPDQKEYMAAKAEGYQGTFAEFQRAQKASHAAAPESVREYETAKSQGFEGNLQDWLAWKAGNKPLTATDKKAIIEADEYQNTGKAAIDNLTRAISLNDKIYTGHLAGPRAYVMSKAPINDEDAIATREVDNLVKTQAVEQLKQIFGGMPTEGERQILLDLQGDMSENPKVREALWKRAIKMAQHRMDLAKDQSEGIRSGTYFKPGGNRSQNPANELRDVPERKRPTATGPNGQRMEYDGNAWVPMQ